MPLVTIRFPAVMVTLPVVEGNWAALKLSLQMRLPLASVRLLCEPLTEPKVMRSVFTVPPLSVKFAFAPEKRPMRTPVAPRVALTTPPLTTILPDCKSQFAAQSRLPDCNVKAPPTMSKLD